MPTTFRKILCATDYSDLSAHAAQCACDLANVFDAELFCLHVVDDAYQYWAAMGPEGIPMGPAPDEVLEAARRRMEDFRARHLTGAKGGAKTHIALGRPFVEIISYARENQIDLIVLGTHGRGVIAHALLGGTAEKVVRKAPCAVLTVRTGEHPYSPP